MDARDELRAVRFAWARFRSDVTWKAADVSTIENDLSDPDLGWRLADALADRLVEVVASMGEMFEADPEETFAILEELAIEHAGRSR
jgi:CRP-like cAMP-binding protein